MSDLLTRDEYGAKAESLELPRTALIDGRFRAARSGKTFATVNPASAAARTFSSRLR